MGNVTRAAVGHFLRFGTWLVCVSLLALPPTQPARAHAPRAMAMSPRYIQALTITVPASVSLGSTSPGGTLGAQLGPVTVTTDPSTNWVASVSATNFQTGGGTPAQTIANSRVSYWSGVATSAPSTGTFTPGQPAAGNAQTLNVSRTAYSASGVTFGGSLTWNPTLVVSVPAVSVAGTYTGTVTHSVL